MLVLGFILLSVLVIKGVDNEDKVIDKPVVLYPTEINDKPVKFGVMADVHLDWDNFEKFLKISKQRGEEFVIVAGDLTSLGKENELVSARNVVDRSGVKYYVVPGNHDLWMANKTKEPLFNQVFGRDYQSFKQGNNKFILVNNGNYLGLGNNQWLWLQNEVGECRVLTCVAVMHMPLNHNFSNHIMGEGSTMVTVEASNLIKLFQENNVREIIAGHLHYSTSYELGGIRTTIVGAVSEERNNQTPRYTEFVIDNGQLEREVVEGGGNDIGG